MTRSLEYERLLDSLRAHNRVIGRSSEGAHVVELDGVVATVCRKVPERSYPNSVVYESGAALIDAIPGLARAYDDAGVQGWTVWVPEEDTEVAQALADAGHHLDADPAAMTLDLAALPEPADDLDYRTGEGVMPLVASINDRAYPFEGTPFTDMTAQYPEGTSWDYVAFADGEPVASVVIHPVEGDASVQFVATLPEARGRGLASRLMRRALWDARERGCDLSSLQATKGGEPIYARMGYRSHGALQMWERRG